MRTITLMRPLFKACICLVRVKMNSLKSSRVVTGTSTEDQQRMLLSNNGVILDGEELKRPMLLTSQVLYFSTWRRKESYTLYIYATLDIDVYCTHQRENIEGNNISKMPPPYLLLRFCNKIRGILQQVSSRPPLLTVDGRRNGSCFFLVRYFKPDV